MIYVYNICTHTYTHTHKDGKRLSREWAVVLEIDASGGNAYKSVLQCLFS